MRKFIIAAAALLIAGPALAQEQHRHDTDQAEHSEHSHAADGQMPEGWNVRVDRDQSPDGIMFHAMEGHFHAITGPAGVFYNPDWSHSGDYAFSARFRQNRAPTHPESYGIVVGGRELDGEGQAYSYFLVRGTGEYFIATRDGAERTVVTPWTRHEAITMQDADTGRQVNVLGVEVQGDEVIFFANGTEVARHPTSAIRTDGLAGFRINHNLDVRIDEVER